MQHTLSHTRRPNEQTLAGPDARRAPQTGRPEILLAEALASGDLHAIAVCRLVAHHHGVTLKELFQPSRSRAPIAAVRQMAMYLVHTVARRTMTDTGAFFGRDRTTVAHACAKVEDLRDQFAFDTELMGLETRLEGLFGEPECLARVAAGGDNDE